MGDRHRHLIHCENRCNPRSGSKDVFDSCKIKNQNYLCINSYKYPRAKYMACSSPLEITFRIYAPPTDSYYINTSSLRNCKNRKVTVPFTKTLTSSITMSTETTHEVSVSLAETWGNRLLNLLKAFNPSYKWTQKDIKTSSHQRTDTIGPINVKPGTILQIKQKVGKVGYWNIQSLDYKIEISNCPKLLQPDLQNQTLLQQNDYEVQSENDLLYKLVFLVLRYLSNSDI